MPRVPSPTLSGARFMLGWTRASVAYVLRYRDHGVPCVAGAQKVINEDDPFRPFFPLSPPRCPHPRPRY